MRRYTESDRAALAWLGFLHASLLCGVLVALGARWAAKPAIIFAILSLFYFRRVLTAAKRANRQTVFEADQQHASECANGHEWHYKCDKCPATLRAEQ